MLRFKIRSMTDALVSIGGTVLGVALGWALSWWTSKTTLEQQRADVREERVRQRQDEAAQVMDNALLEASDKVPPVHGTDGFADAAAAFWEVESEWRRGWVRSTLIEDREMNDRYAAVGLMAHICAQALNDGQPVMPLPINRAISNARRALAAFRREADLPPATFPSRDELRTLTQGQGAQRFDKLTDWLLAHPEPA
jgi:hypothetical protein